jgi:kynurenine formamidase
LKAFDLTHIISGVMPAYPGTEPPEITTACTLEKDRFVEQKISFYSHTGTHLDTPAHIFPEGATLDMLAVDKFFGAAVALDFSAIDRDVIVKEDFTPHLALLKKAEFILLYTGWSAKWGSDSYFTGFPVLSEEAANWLSGFGLKGVGIDAISLDRVGTEDFPVHKAFLSKSTVIIENLTNLEPLLGKCFDFYCFPLRFADGDGSPVRAVAIQAS